MPVAAVTRRAIDAFGDEDTARRWLDSENVALGGARPLDLLGSELETAEVESVLTRIEYGDFA
jgi:putative toxin-antitoxin system antitoxin component (TIGR02293 family)